MEGLGSRVVTHMATKCVYNIMGTHYSPSVGVKGGLKKFWVWSFAVVANCSQLGFTAVTVGSTGKYLSIRMTSSDHSCLLQRTSLLSVLILSMFKIVAFPLTLKALSLSIPTHNMRVGLFTLECQPTAHTVYSIPWRSPDNRNRKICL